MLRRWEGARGGSKACLMEIRSLVVRGVKGERRKRTRGV